MLCVASLLNVVTTEAISTGYVIASLVVGPVAAVLGGLVHRGPKIIASAGLALYVMTGSAHAQGATATVDPSKSPFGERSTRASQELDAFAFLIGKWDGAGRTRLPDGKIVEYSLTWIGRYILDGTAIADEVHGTAPDGSLAVGITFRQYDRETKTWIIELLGVPNSQLVRQVHRGVGSVTVSERNVTVISDGRFGKIREHYVVSDNDSWVYRVDDSNDGGKSWNEGRIEYTLRRSK